MKTYYLIALSFLVFVSCSKDDTVQSESSAYKEILEFKSRDEMSKKIQEIILLKNQKQQLTLNEFTSRNNYAIEVSHKKQTNEEKTTAILLDLKKYSIDKLNDIYDLRKELNFTSIQSIAEEINSLALVDPLKADELENKYKKFLSRNEYQVEAIFDKEIANVVNGNGEVLINGKKIEITSKEIEINSTGKFIRYEAEKSDVVAKSSDFNFTVIYQAGREVHENDLGVKFFKYYCNLAALYRIRKTPPYNGSPYLFIPCPTTYTVNSGSFAAFVQTGSDFFSDYAFGYNYPSGFGEIVSYVGGNKNTPYVPAGGKVSGHFSTNTGGFYQEMTGNVTYE
jgi:hypothetical protein